MVKVVARAFEKSQSRRQMHTIHVTLYCSYNYFSTIIHLYQPIIYKAHKLSNADLVTYVHVALSKEKKKVHVADVHIDLDRSNYCTERVPIRWSSDGWTWESQKKWSSWAWFQRLRSVGLQIIIGFDGTELYVVQVLDLI